MIDVICVCMYGCSLVFVVPVLSIIYPSESHIISPVHAYRSETLPGSYALFNCQTNIS